MRRETRLALKLVVEKAQRLRDGPYVRALTEQGGTRLSYKYKRGENDADSTFAIEHSHPDDDATDALVLTFRFFIQKNEMASFRWLNNNVLDDPGLSDEWKHDFTEVRSLFNGFLDQFSGITERVVAPAPDGATDRVQLVGEYQLTNHQIMDTFIYGGMAHAELPKREVLMRWKSNPLGFQAMQMQFDRVMMVGLRAIAYVSMLSEGELAAHASSAPSAAPDSASDTVKETDMATDVDVAQWMLDRVRQEGSLYQPAAVADIESKFGSAFVYINENGNPAILPKVLAKWRRLSKGIARWENADKCWYLEDS